MLEILENQALVAVKANSCNGCFFRYDNGCVCKDIKCWRRPQGKKSLNYQLINLLKETESDKEA